MLKLPHNCTHLTRWQSNAQNSRSQAWTVHELRISRCTTGFRKDRGTRDQINNICWIIEKAREFQIICNSSSLTMLKPLTVWITTNCGKFFKRGEYQTTLPASWEICMPVKKQQLGPDMEQWTGFKLGNEYIKDIYCHPAYLIYMQSTSCKILGLMKHKLESRLLGEISITSDMQMTPPLWQKVKKN